jgi:hypothetical protein
VYKLRRIETATIKSRIVFFLASFFSMKAIFPFV